MFIAVVFIICKKQKQYNIHNQIDKQKNTLYQHNDNIRPRKKTVPIHATRMYFELISLGAVGEQTKKATYHMTPLR